jgi:hypothetical protein
MRTCRAQLDAPGDREPTLDERVPFLEIEVGVGGSRGDGGGNCLVPAGSAVDPDVVRGEAHAGYDDAGESGDSERQSPGHGILQTRTMLLCSGGATRVAAGNWSVAVRMQSAPVTP